MLKHNWKNASNVLEVIKGVCPIRFMRHLEAMQIDNLHDTFCAMPSSSKLKKTMQSKRDFACF